MSACVECPICMDAIDITKNCVVTECGHHFHAKCLMQNVAHNGFDCPYCRAAMAEEVEDDEDSDGESFYSDEEDEEVSEVFSDRALFAFRQLFRMNSADDGVDEEDDDDYEEEEEEEEEEEPRRELPFENFVQKFQEANISYEQMVKVFVIDSNMDYNPTQDEDRMMRRFYDMIDRFVCEINNRNNVVDEPAVAPPAPSAQIAN